MRLLSTFTLALVLPALASAQTPVTISTGAGSAEQVHYSLANGVQATVPAAGWDLAFEITGFTASIRINAVGGVRAYKAPYAVGQWAALDTTGMAAGWVEAFDSDTSWSHGALNTGLTANEFDLGWGVYNPVTHIVAGDSLFVVRTEAGSWKKLRIDGLATGTYQFTWADLDGSNEQTGTLAKAAFTGRNFGYFSFGTGSTLDREPPTTDWQLLFTKYIGFVPTPYPVVGVLHNKNVEVLQVDGVDPSMADWTGLPFDTHINAIGSDWKTFNMTTFQYEIAADRTYFVKDQEGNIWKLVFTGFGGSATGTIDFTQELVSATGIAEATAQAAPVLFPNPSTDGAVQIVCDGTGMATLDIVDMAGRVVREQRIALDGTLRLVPLEAGALRPGAYQVVLRTATGTGTSRLIVQ